LSTSRTEKRRRMFRGTSSKVNGIALRNIRTSLSLSLFLRVHLTCEQTWSDRPFRCTRAIVLLLNRPGLWLWSIRRKSFGVRKDKEQASWPTRITSPLLGWSATHLARPSVTLTPPLPKSQPFCTAGLCSTGLTHSWPTAQLLTFQGHFGSLLCSSSTIIHFYFPILLLLSSTATQLFLKSHSTIIMITNQFFHSTNHSDRRFSVVLLALSFSAVPTAAPH
jgi:hypothetical protein